MTGQTLDLTREQRVELALYRDGAPHKRAHRPNGNLIRRGMLTLAPASGKGFYRVTGLGRAALRAAGLLPESDVDPRDLHNRFRVYRQRGRGRAECIATTPEPAGIGVAIVTLAADGELLVDDRVGVLDACPGGEPSETGTWIVNPYPKGLA